MARPLQPRRHPIGRARQEALTTPLGVVVAGMAVLDAIRRAATERTWVEVEG
jgi:hypothetical protein